jgi:DNA primase
VLPIRDRAGRTVGFGARALGDGEPKYLNSPEGPLFAKRHLLYGIDRAHGAMRRSGEAIVVEGYFDVIACHQAGLEQAVASLGTAIGRDALLLLRREAGRVVFAYDADAAGVKAAGAALALCGGLGLEARAARLEGGKDPAEVVAVRGGDALRLAIERARGRTAFVLEQALEGGRAATPEGKAEVAREVLAVLVEESSPVTRAAYLREIAERLALPEESLAREMERLGQRGERAQAPRRAMAKMVNRGEKIGNDNPSKRRHARSRREEELAALVLNAPDVGRAVGVDAGRFEDAELARIVAMVLGSGIEALTGELSRRAASLLLGENDIVARYPDPEAAARDLWQRLEADFAKAQRAAWQERIADLERRGERAPEPYLEAVRREVRQRD